MVVVARAKKEHYSSAFPVPLKPTLNILLPNHLCSLCTHIFRAVALRTSVIRRLKTTDFTLEIFLTSCSHPGSSSHLRSYQNLKHQNILQGSQRSTASFQHIYQGTWPKVGFLVTRLIRPAHYFSQYLHFRWITQYFLEV